MHTTLTGSFCKMHFNNIHPSMPASRKWLFSLSIFRLRPKLIFRLACACCMSYPPQPPQFLLRQYCLVKSMYKSETLECNFPCPSVTSIFLVQILPSICSFQHLITWYSAVRVRDQVPEVAILYLWNWACSLVFLPSSWRSFACCARYSTVKVAWPFTHHCDVRGHREQGPAAEAHCVI